MLHNRVKVLKKSRRMLSIVLAGAITVTSIPGNMFAEQNS